MMSTVLVPTAPKSICMKLTFFAPRCTLGPVIKKPILMQQKCIKTIKGNILDLSVFYSLIYFAIYIKTTNTAPLEDPTHLMAALLMLPIATTLK